ncbi:MAG: hypothetical protein J5610_04150 [Prevotella sp.]|nr:hypothetical protein [Prevotella sp.]
MMKALLSFLRIKREERVTALAALFYVIILNGLVIYKYYDSFTRARKGGFWSLFWDHFCVSGFDSYTYIALSKWSAYYEVSRHPLLAYLVWPFAKLNEWLMPLTGTNWAVFIVAVFLVLLTVYSAVFLFRIFHTIIGLKSSDANLMTALFFSSGYVMLTVCVPDHFCLSMFLLTATLYFSGQLMQQRKMMSAWQTAVFFFLTAGVTLTNGVKTLLAQWFTGGLSFFHWRNILVAAVIPTVLLGGIAFLENKYVAEPMHAKGRNIQEKRMQKDAKFKQRLEGMEQRMKKATGENLGKHRFLEWADVTTSRSKSLVDNLFGESIQLHRQYLLEDIHDSRPVFVGYDLAVNYVVEAIIVLLFLFGIVIGLHDKFFFLCLSWFGFDMLMHLGFGFGLNEVYIMAAHWIFVIPIALAYLLKRLSPSMQPYLRIPLFLLVFWLFLWNGYFISTYMTIS